MEEKSNYPIWHPYTQMQTADFPIEIASAKGAKLYAADGRVFIDAISSWWTNIHGHSHPYIAQKIAEQAASLEQVIFAGFTHRPAVDLANRLLEKLPYHDKVFYSDNGSTAVEAALKMALQFWSNKGTPRTKIIAFSDAYHGDTFGSMSVSARCVFNAPYSRLLFDVEFIDAPYPGNEQKSMAQLEQVLREQKDDIAAFIFEPLVLGSAGMKMYSASALDKFLQLCQANNVLTIADEVFTGFGRTGTFMAMEQCVLKPDITCLSKGITGGFMPFAATLCTQEIYEAFLSNEKAKMLLHGHSYTGNPLGCAAALASLDLFEQEQTMQRIAQIAKWHQAFYEKIKQHKSVLDIRQTGTILAIELRSDAPTGYLNQISQKVTSFFLEKAVLIRPLGNVIYVLPPYCVKNEEISQVYSSIDAFLQDCFD
jgi:adenosylmethionine-8-amino-7-oxononanoate aminotransferase